MTFPYKEKKPPSSWQGWYRLKELENVSFPLSKEEQDLLGYISKYERDSFLQAIIDKACASPEFTAVCLIRRMTTYGFEYQTEFVQLQDGSFLIQEWNDQTDIVIGPYSTHFPLDLTKELKCLRQEGINLRSSDNNNPNLDDPGIEGRYCYIYLAVGTDLEWFGYPGFYSAGRYKNNAANRILLAEHGKDNIKLI